jgi:hypothetical protein
MIYRSRFLRATTAAALALALSMAAQAVEVGGYKINDTIELAGAVLKLNGAGIRYKGPFKVYAAAMYFDKKASTTEEVYTRTGPRRIHLVLLRELDANDLGNLFIRAIKENTPSADMLKILPAVSQMGQIFASQQKGLIPGESITIDWIPDTGTVIRRGETVIGTPSKDPEFFRAMLAIWLGKNPPDWMLKDALLGINSAR